MRNIPAAMLYFGTFENLKIYFMNKSGKAPSGAEVYPHTHIHTDLLFDIFWFALVLIDCLATTFVLQLVWLKMKK